MKETHFYPRYRAEGQELIDVYGYGAPLWITDPGEEYQAVRERAGVLDFSMLLKIDVEGPKARDHVNTLVARDLDRLPEGRIAYGPVVTDDGKMVDDSTVFNFSRDRVRVCGGPGMPVNLTPALEEVGLKVTSRREDMCHMCLQGPKSREILGELTGADVSNDAFPYYTFREDLSISGIPVFLTRMGFTAELGYEIWGPADRALALWDLVFETGAKHDIRVVGAAAIMMLRLEAGMVMGEGLEYDQTVTPFECRLGWAVPKDKPGDYQGKDALARARDDSPTRIVSAVFPAGVEEADGLPIVHDGQEVGHVTMAVPSPYLDGQTLAFVRVPRGLATPGTTIEIGGGKDVAGEVVATPVYDPDRTRVHG